MNHAQRVSVILEKYPTEWERTSGKKFHSLTYFKGFFTLKSRSMSDGQPFRLVEMESMLQVLKARPDFKPPQYTDPTHPSNTPTPKSNENWNNNAIQYPRLIAEIQMAGGFTNELIDPLADSMDLSCEEIRELIDRACTEWDSIKAKIKV